MYYFRKLIGSMFSYFLVQCFIFKDILETISFLIILSNKKIAIASLSGNV